MSQPGSRKEWLFDPVIPASESPDTAEILVSGPLEDSDLESRLRRLEARFALFLRHAPPGPGRRELVTPELRALCETYLPVAEIVAAFRRLLRLSFRTGVRPPPLPDALSWPELLSAFPECERLSPARWLSALTGDERFRTRFLFHLALPRRHGESFGRYPRQDRFLREWLQREKSGKKVAVLDAACGTGEGTWEAAGILLEAGFPPERFRISGETIGFLEAFAAARACFPHDCSRQERFRERIAPLIAAGAAESITFAAADLLAPPGPDRYDVVRCNGLLGGPLLHRPEELANAVRGLTARLAPGGLFLAADSFHGGWKKRISPDALAGHLLNAGLEPIPAPEGVAAVSR